MDLLLASATVVDGSGGPARRADVGIAGDRIVAVGPEVGLTPAGRAAPRVDLAGLALAPGFVDIHTHSDYQPLVDPSGGSRVGDGITLEISGNCGFSPFPLCEEEAAEEARALPGLTVDWRDFDQYLDRLERKGMGLSRAWLVGHGTLRSWAMGRVDRRPTPGELSAMEAELDRCLERGALGFSTGLIYSPGCFAEPAEIEALARVVARHGKLYASHIRGEGDTLLEAIDEVLAVARATGVRTQVSHLKASKPQNWHKLPLAIARIEAARAEGLDVMADRYPYTATSTGLTAILPDRALVGGREAIARRCRGPERAELAADLARRYPPDYWGRITVATMGPADLPEVLGRTVAEVAEARGMSPAETALDLVAESTAASECVYHVLDEEGLAEVLRRPWVFIGSDGSALSAEGPLSIGHPHPRSFGTFARVLGRYVRELGILSLEDAVWRMTRGPADRVGLSDRGRIEAGAVADLVAFDPATVTDRATYQDPKRYSAGIHRVWVSGTEVLGPGGPTGALPGRPVLVPSQAVT